MIRILSLMAALACAIAVAAPIAAQEAKADLDYFVGTWICEYEWQGATMLERTSYTRADENTLNVVVEVHQNGKKVDTATGTISHDPATGVLSSVMESPAAGFRHTTREIRREGATTWFDGSSTMPGMDAFRIRIVKNSPTEHTWTMFIQDGNDWTEFLTTVYRRQ